MTEKCPLIKFADDTAMAGLIDKDDESEFRSQVNNFLDYCDRNTLELNVYWGTKVWNIDINFVVFKK